MARTEAQKRAQQEYNKRNVKKVYISFYPKDEELYNVLAAQENKAGFLKQLLADYIERTRADI